MSRVVLLAVLIAGCATAKQDDEAEMILTGPRSFVSAAYDEARRCGYRDIVRNVRAGADKVAVSNLDRRSPQAECFGEWIANVPGATFEVAAAEVVY